MQDSVLFTRGEIPVHAEPIQRWSVCRGAVAFSMTAAVIFHMFLNEWIRISYSQELQDLGSEV